MTSGRHRPELALTAALAALAGCSADTQLIVLVESDLAPGLLSELVSSVEVVRHATSHSVGRIRISAPRRGGGRRPPR